MKRIKLSLWQRFKNFAKRTPHFFAKCIIVHCIAVVTIAAYWSLYAQFRGAEMAVLFGAIATPFITELAMLLIKTVKNKKGETLYASDVDKQNVRYSQVGLSDRPTGDFCAGGYAGPDLGYPEHGEDRTDD